MNFNNRVALVTGAAVGIGRATSLLLAQNGASLILVDITDRIANFFQEFSKCIRKELSSTKKTGTFAKSNTEWKA